MANRGEKKDEDVEANPFTAIDKSQVLQEARIFHDLQINARKCCLLLTKILYLTYQGEIFATTEATELFFAITKLFQSKDVTLRRMVYLVIKELADVAQDVIIVTSSLQKDMNAKSDVVYRANAIRALCKITDSSMVAGMERFFKQAIVDKNQTVASAALVSACHLFNDNKEVVKRWVNEVQEACNSKSVMVQYHALGLMYQIRQRDRMAVTKLVQSFAKGALRSPYAHCMLIRYAVKVMEEEDSSNGAGRSLYEHLETSLRHKSEMVVFEAARAICSLPEVTSKELMPALAVLQLFLSSPKPTLRFAAIRTLNKVAMSHAFVVAACNLDMENLITDPNRSISTLAITTLLKTGNEASVDRLMKQIEGFMSEISDEFKVVVIDAIRALCIKFPNKQSTMLNFLANNLREDGGYEFKHAIVEALMTFVAEIPDSKEIAIGCLCEFIEDCEFSQLAVRILHLLGREGPTIDQPSRCVRYIYNRVILENAIVRAAAVSALARFGVVLESLRPSIVVLLTRCLNDNDDEVRDRATFYLNVIKSDVVLAKQYIAADTIYSVAALERALAGYCADPQNAVTAPFDPRAIPKISTDQEIAEPQRKPKETMTEEVVPTKAVQAAVSDERTLDQYAAALNKVPELSQLGTLLASSKTIELTESETEYNVSVVKHIFRDYVVFQFDCLNTLNDQLLEGVHVQMEHDSEEDIKQELFTTISALSFDKKQAAYVVYRKPAEGYPAVVFTNTLKFIVKDCDPETGEADPEGYPDEYALESVELTLADYMLPHQVNNFKQAWDEMGEEHQVSETYQLTAIQSIADAVDTVIQYLGMRPSEKTGTVPADKTTHMLLLSGNLMGQIITLVRVRLVFNQATGITMELAVRSTDSEVSQLIASAIQ